MYPGDSRLFNDCSRRKTANYRDRSDKDDRGLVDSSLALIPPSGSHASGSRARTCARLDYARAREIVIRR